jgi:hypothetical protein
MTQCKILGFAKTQLMKPAGTGPKSYLVINLVLSKKIPCDVPT